MCIRDRCYRSKLDFTLDTSVVGNSEMQHLDFAYASSLIRSFLNDESLVLTIRGRKYTPKFEFTVGHNKIVVESVQTEVDAGYEGRHQVVSVSYTHLDVYKRQGAAFAPAGRATGIDRGRLSPVDAGAGHQ